MLLMAMQWLINTCIAHQEIVSSNITVLDINIKSPIYSVPNFSSIANICGNVINSWNFISIHLASDRFVLGKHVFCVDAPHFP